MNKQLITAVASVAMTLLAAPAFATAQTTDKPAARVAPQDRGENVPETAPLPLERYGDRNPYNKIDPSTVNPERVGGFKVAQPWPRPGSDPHGPLTSSEVRAAWAQDRSANTDDSDRFGSRNASDDRMDGQMASDRQPPVESRVIAPRPSDASNQAAVNNNMNTWPSAQGQNMQGQNLAGVDYRFIKPADPAVVNPDVRGNGGQDRVLAEDRYLRNQNASVNMNTGPAQIFWRDVSNNPIDSKRDPRFQPTQSGLENASQNPGQNTDLGAQPAGDRARPDTQNNTGGYNNNSNNNSTGDSLNTGPRGDATGGQNAGQTPSAMAGDSSAMANDATLDLPGIRQSLSKFVDQTLSTGSNPRDLNRFFARQDQTRLESATDNQQVQQVVRDLRTAWRNKYNSELAGTNTTSALADGFRIMSGSPSRPGISTGGDNAQPASERQPAASGDNNASNVSAATVIIPIAAICEDRSADNRDPNAGAMDKARGQVGETAGKALDATGDQVNRLGNDGNRVGDAMNRSGQTLQQQGQNLQDRGQANQADANDKYGKAGEKTVALVKEAGDWKIDLPDSESGDGFRQKLADSLRVLVNNQDQWPQNPREGYRMLTAHVLASVAQ